jgi:hypothetical protein
MNFPCPLDAFDDIARLIRGAIFLSCFGAVWCYKTETSKTESSIIKKLPVIALAIFFAVGTTLALAQGAGGGAGAGGAGGAGADKAGKTGAGKTDAGKAGKTGAGKTGAGGAGGSAGGGAGGDDPANAVPKEGMSRYRAR